MLFFYSLSFLFRPWRALKLAGSLITGDSSTKLTMALANTARKRRGIRSFDRMGGARVHLPSVGEPTHPRI
jgi:hypothetical protein